MNKQIKDYLTRICKADVRRIHKVNMPSKELIEIDVSDAKFKANIVINIPKDRIKVVSQ